MQKEQIFKELVEMMGLKVVEQPEIEIIDDRAPRYMREIAKLSIEKDYNKKVKDDGFEILSTYFLNKISIFRGELIATNKRLNLNADLKIFEEVELIAQLALSALHLGVDENGKHWEVLYFRDKDKPKYFANWYAYKFFELHNMESHKELLKKTAKRRPNNYGDFLKDIDIELEAMNKKLLKERQYQ